MKKIEENVIEITEEELTDFTAGTFNQLPKDENIEIPELINIDFDKKKGKLASKVDKKEVKVKEYIEEQAQIKVDNVFVVDSPEKQKFTGLAKEYLAEVYNYCKSQGLNFDEIKTDYPSWILGRAMEAKKNKKGKEEDNYQAFAQKILDIQKELTQRFYQDNLHAEHRGLTRHFEQIFSAEGNQEDKTRASCLITSALNYLHHLGVLKPYLEKKQKDWGINNLDEFMHLDNGKKITNKFIEKMLGGWDQVKGDSRKEGPSIIGDTKAWEKQKAHQVVKEVINQTNKYSVVDGALFARELTTLFEITEVLKQGQGVILMESNHAVLLSGVWQDEKNIKFILNDPLMNVRAAEITLNQLVARFRTTEAAIHYKLQPKGYKPKMMVEIEQKKPESGQEPQQEVKLTRAPASELAAEQLKLKESYAAALEDLKTEFLKPGFDKLKFLLEKRNLTVNRETITPYLKSIESVISQRLQEFCEIKEKQGVKLDYFPLVPAAMETLMGWVKEEEIVIKDKEILTLQEETSAQQKENKNLKAENQKLKTEISGLNKQPQEQQKLTENLQKELEQTKEIIAQVNKAKENLQQELNTAQSELTELKQKSVAPALPELSKERKKAIQEKTEQELTAMLASNEVLQRAYLIKDKLEAILSLLGQDKDNLIDVNKFNSIPINLNFFIDSIEKQHKNRIALLAEAEEKGMSKENREYLAELIKQEKEFSSAKKYEEGRLVDRVESQDIVPFICMLDDTLANHPKIYETISKEELESFVQDLIKTSELEEIKVKSGDKYNAVIHEPVRWEQNTGKPQEEVIKIIRRGFIKNKKVLLRTRIIVAH